MLLVCGFFSHHGRPPSLPALLEITRVKPDSFLTLKGDFKLVDGLQPAETPDAIGASSSSGGSGGGAEAEPTGDEAAAAVAGQEGGGGGPLTRGRSLYDSVGEEGEVEPRRVPGSRSLFLPFGKPAEGEGAEDDDDDRVQLVVGVAMEVRNSFLSSGFHRPPSV